MKFGFMMKKVEKKLDYNFKKIINLEPVWLSRIHGSQTKAVS